MRFCEGQPQRGARPLTTAERRALEGAVRRARWRSVLALAGLGAPFAVFVVAAVVAELLRLDREAGMPALGVLGFFALLGGLPAAILFARDTLRAASALRRDLARGEALAFGEGIGEVAVLPASGRVVGRGGAAVAPGPRAVLGDAAPPPEAPPTYALSAAELPERLRAGGWTRRALSPDERAELAEHAARLGHASWPLVTLTVVFAAATAAALGQDRPPGAGLLPALAWAVLLGLGWFRVLRRRSEAAALRADAAEGWAWRGRPEGAGECELLPASGATWIEEGSPAEWRLRRER